MIRISTLTLSLLLIAPALAQVPEPPTTPPARTTEYDFRQGEEAGRAAAGKEGKGSFWWAFPCVCVPVTLSGMGWMLPNMGEPDFAGWLLGPVAGTAMASGLVGCCGASLITAGVSLLSKPSPPSEELLGKSSHYIRGFTSGYRKQVTKNRIRSAITGALVGFGTGIVIDGATFAIIALTK